MDESPVQDGEMITFWDGTGDATAADGTPIEWGESAPDDAATSPMGMTTDQKRRDFLRTLAAAGMAGVAGCAGGNGDGGNGGGGNGVGNPGTTDGSGGNGNGDGGNGSGGNGNGNGDGSPGSGDPIVPEADAPFLLPSGTVDSTFDVELTPETVMIEGDARDAVLEIDPDDHRYVLDATRLADAGLSLSEGSILWLSGVDMRRVSGISRDGDRLTVETEFAALNEAISDGDIAWDASLGLDTSQVVTELADGGGGGGGGGGGTNSVRPLDGSGSLDTSQATLVDVTMLDREGGEWPVEQFSQAGPSISWTFKQDNRQYTFGLTPGSGFMELKAEVKGPLKGPVGGNPNIRLTGIGRLKEVKSKASASYGSKTLNSMDYEASKLAGELKLDIVSSASGAYNFKWDFPGALFKWVIFVGALPVTITVATALIASVSVPAQSTASASTTIKYDGKSGFTYDGTDVKGKVEFAGFGFDPSRADSSAYIGVAVDLQFGIQFPKMSVGVFGTLFVPYLALEMYIGSSLQWGPVCKKGYVRFRSTLGYDLTVLGVSIAKDKEILLDRQNPPKEKQVCETPAA